MSLSAVWYALMPAANHDSLAYLDRVVLPVSPPDATAALAGTGRRTDALAVLPRVPNDPFPVHAVAHNDHVNIS